MPGKILEIPFVKISVKKIVQNPSVRLSVPGVFRRSPQQIFVRDLKARRPLLSSPGLCTRSPPQVSRRGVCTRSPIRALLACEISRFVGDCAVGMHMDMSIMSQEPFCVEKDVRDNQGHLYQIEKKKRTITPTVRTPQCDHIV